MTKSTEDGNEDEEEMGNKEVNKTLKMSEDEVKEEEGRSRWMRMRLK